MTVTMPMRATGPVEPPVGTLRLARSAPAAVALGISSFALPAPMLVHIWHRRSYATGCEAQFRPSRAVECNEPTAERRCLASSCRQRVRAHRRSRFIMRKTGAKEDLARQQSDEHRYVSSQFVVPGSSPVLGDWLIESWVAQWEVHCLGGRRGRVFSSIDNALLVARENARRSGGRVWYREANGREPAVLASTLPT